MHEGKSLLGHDGPESCVVVRGKVSLLSHPPLGDKKWKESKKEREGSNQARSFDESGEDNVADAAKISCRWLIVCTFGPIITSGSSEASP